MPPAAIGSGGTSNAFSPTRPAGAEDASSMGVMILPVSTPDASSWPDEAASTGHFYSMRKARNEPLPATVGKRAKRMAGTTDASGTPLNVRTHGVDIDLSLEDYVRDR